MDTNLLQYDPLEDDKSLVGYLDHMGSDGAIVEDARVSYQNDAFYYGEVPADVSVLLEMRPQIPFDAERDTKLLRFLLKNSHTSPLEHSYIKFHVACPLFVKYQWTRHRTWSYWNLNEVSRRYTSEEIEVYIPKVLRGQAAKNRQASEGTITDPRALASYKHAVRSAVERYDLLIQDGVARELARAVLPEALYTRFHATANLHNILHYHKLRDDPHAQLEIRKYAECIGHIVQALFPYTWMAYKEVA